MKFNDVFQDTVEKIINNSKQVPMLLGEPGIGKSSWVEDLGRKLHTKVFTLACNQLADKADLTGARLVPVETANGETTYEQVFYMPLSDVPSLMQSKTHMRHLFCFSMS